MAAGNYVINLKHKKDMQAALWGSVAFVALIVLILVVVRFVRKRSLWLEGSFRRFGRFGKGAKYKYVRVRRSDDEDDDGMVIVQQPSP